MRFAISVMIVLVLAAPAVAQDEVSHNQNLVSSYEARVARSISSAEQMTVSVIVDRDVQARSLRNTPMRTGGVFAKRPPSETPTSGMILDGKGYILTTAFNVTGGKVNSVHVILPDGTKVEAEVVGYHQPADIALLKVADELEFESPGKADLKLLKPGVAVVAAGRGPDGKGLTVTPGVFSAPGRHGGRAIQTDCRLNYGSAGGPLFNEVGDWLGMTVQVSTASAASFGQNSGVSFALPHSEIAKLLPDLRKGVKLDQPKRTFLGIRARDWEDGKGVEIDQVMAGTAAEAAGLEAGDVILKFGEDKVEAMGQLQSIIRERKVGDKVTITIQRNGEEQKLVVTLGESTGR